MHGVFHRITQQQRVLLTETRLVNSCAWWRVTSLKSSWLGRRCSASFSTWPASRCANFTRAVRGLAWLQPPAAACVTRDLRAPGSDGSREAELRAWLWPRLHEQLSLGCPSAAGTRRNSAVL